ncbi:hypothetical protein ATN84_16355 [Paramesorhizobium deserti]|uniref:HTH luxR-type domain-containing protein n=2 Tax=Paramesorhizobium deserti TaxID=1494590 RepID=A0A135HQV3_9HYPH|nr:hypothetical protein ATN84_16355 [Paramesorhizobium deserti]
MRLFMPHLQQALQMQLKLAELSQACDMALETLEHARHGIVLATHDGRVLFTNSAAIEVFDRRDGLSLRTSQLRAALANENIILRRLVGAAGKGDNNGFRSGGSLAISRPSGCRSLVIHVLPLGSKQYGFTCPNASVLVLIIDPEHQQGASQSVLRRLYGLTKAESAVALSIARGDGLQSVADELSISLSTARTHLQRVFEKTDTHRQAELVRLLLDVQVGLR